jgi:hypothetical protein
MNEIMMYKKFIEDVARKTQRAFLDVRQGVIHKRLTDEQRAAMNSLPHDNITNEPENRLRKFPNDCCMDAAFVLAVIFTAISEQKGFKFGELLHIRCTPTPKTKTVMFDFHQWLRVDGFDVDITVEQLKTLQKANGGKVVFEPHPIIQSDDYIFEGGKAGIEEVYAEFANFVITNYLGRASK